MPLRNWTGVNDSMPLQNWTGVNDSMPLQNWTKMPACPSDTRAEFDMPLRKAPRAHGAQPGTAGPGGARPGRARPGRARPGRPATSLPGPGGAASGGPPPQKTKQLAFWQPRGPQWALKMSAVAWLPCLLCPAKPEQTIRSSSVRWQNQVIRIIVTGLYTWHHGSGFLNRFTGRCRRDQHNLQKGQSLTRNSLRNMRAVGS